MAITVKLGRILGITIVLLASLVVVEQSAGSAWLCEPSAAAGVGWDWAADVSATPVAQAQITPTVMPSFHPNARVQAGRGGLRVRSVPGTAGSVLAQLTALTDLEIIGRTANNEWLEVVTPELSTGWVWAGYVQVGVDLTGIPVSGVADDARPTAMAAAGGQSGSVPAGGGQVRAPLPIISGITDHARQIFLRGQELGNRANVFSKIGDSMTAVDWFLYPIGWNLYDLAGHTELAPVVEYFSQEMARNGFNSFANPSLAAYPAWMIEDILTPGMTAGDIEDGICESNETPLACEYRVVRPAVALIMMGTNDIHMTLYVEFQSNLRYLVEYSIDHGVIPVLSTIPDRLDWRYSEALFFNEFIVETARTYDIPLWDYWGAMRSLPNFGISADGMHPSLAPGETLAAAVFMPENLRYGYTLRNFTALQVLDAIWRQVMN